MHITRITSALLLVAASTMLAQQNPLTAVGAKDSAGKPHGECRIVNTRGGTQGKGKFEHGQMEGSWTFWDSHGVRTVEIIYLHDRPTGLLRNVQTVLTTVEKRGFSGCRSASASVGTRRSRGVEINA